MKIGDHDQAELDTFALFLREISAWDKANLPTRPGPEDPVGVVIWHNRRLAATLEIHKRIYPDSPTPPQ